MSKPSKLYIKALNSQRSLGVTLFANPDKMQRLSNVKKLSIQLLSNIKCFLICLLGNLLIAHFGLYSYNLIAIVIVVYCNFSIKLK